MKKIGLFILIGLAIFTLIAADNFNSIDKGFLPKDGRGKAVQVGRWFQMHDSLQTNIDYLDETDFATHANWDVTNDIDDSNGNAIWTWADSDASTLTQVNADQAKNVRNSQNLLLTYTVYDSTAIAGGTVSAWVTGICDSTALDITSGVDKTLAITTNSSASSGDFVIHIQADSSVTAGKFALDDIELTGYYESPVTIANGSNVILYTPENAVELIVDSKGDEITINHGSSYFNSYGLFSIPCVSDQAITISNDSGSSITLYFVYIMI